VIRAAAKAAASVGAEVPTTTAAAEPVVTTTATTATTTPPRAPAASSTTTLAAGQIFGFVRHQGAPMPGVKLDLTSGSALARTTTTDARGRYSFDGLRPGAYDVALYAESESQPCNPPAPCIGSAVSMQRQPVVVATARRYQLDLEYPFSSAAPQPSPSASTAPASSSTTASTAAY
jgi:hypothetical protein